MKKFLIFLVAIVVVVSFSLTVYYFVRNDEVINFTTKEIYCNVGDTIKQKDLGLTVKKRSKKTTYNYNAAGEDVTSRVSYDAEHGQYVVNKEIDGAEAVGGDVTLVVSTSNKKFAKFEIVLHIGDGSAEYPYNINDQTQLEKIGQVDGYLPNKHYVLRKDVNLTSTYQPIAYFTGTFNGNGRTISGLNLTDVENGIQKAGLFSRINGATVRDLTLMNVNISGDFQSAGALAGEVENSTVSCIEVQNANIASTGVVGGLAGVISSSKDVTSCSVSGVSVLSGQVVGGLVGKLDRSMLRATYAIATVNAQEGATSAKLGGLVGQFVIGSGTGSIQQSYAVATSNNDGFGSFIGSIEKADDLLTANELTYLVGNYCVGPAGKEIGVNSTDLFGTLLNESASDYKITNKTTQTELEQVDEYVFYAITTKKTLWDGNAWYTPSGKLPTLKRSKDVQGLSADFVNKDVSKENIVGGGSDEAADGRLLADFFNNPDKTISLIDGQTYNMTGITISNPKNIKDIVIYGNGAVIDGLTVNGCLFNVVDNCTIKDLTFTNLTITGDAKGLFGSVGSTNYYTSSLISNLSVNYKAGHESYITTVADIFGGLAAEVKDNSTIENAKVSGLTVDADSTNAYVAGLVGRLDSGVIKAADEGVIEIKDVSLSGGNYIAGVVVENSGSIADCQVVGTSSITANNAMFVGGLVAINMGKIENASTATKIAITSKTVNGACVGGLVAINSGDLANCQFVGEGIVVSSVENLTDLFVGGAVAYNQGDIEKIDVTVARVDLLGDSEAASNKNFNLGGIVYSNGGTVSQAVVTADLYANIVAGVAVETTGSIDQVLVGFNSAKRNVIAGDKFVAGVAYNMMNNAEITNVQTRSTIEGKANSTISSLVVLKFPNGTTFANGVIDNEATGFGTLYTETWTNFSTPNHYNLFGEKNSAGLFTSVVINNTHIASGLTVKSSYFGWTLNWFQFNTGYKFSGNKNFFKYAGDEDFAKASTFTGDVKIVANGSTSKGFKLWWDDSFTYSLTFGSEWSTGNGIQLAFLNGAYAE